MGLCVSAKLHNRKPGNPPKRPHYLRNNPEILTELGWETWDAVQDMAAARGKERAQGTPS